MPDAPTMNWEALGAVAELLGAIGVIASLFYLASQIRRNSESVEAATARALTDATQMRLLAAAQNSTLAVAFVKEKRGEELSEAEQSQLAFLTRATIRGIQNTFVQRRRGMVSADMWRGYENLLRQQLRLSVVRDWWADEGETFESDFRELVERLLDQVEP
jgi:hypothetical protein